MIEQAELDKLLDLAAKATPGPWEWAETRLNNKWYRNSPKKPGGNFRPKFPGSLKLQFIYLLKRVYENPIINDEDSGAILCLRWGNLRSGTTEWIWGPAQANKDYIAAACNLAPVLATELAEAKAEINRLVNVEHVVQRLEALDIMSEMVSQRQAELDAARAIILDLVKTIDASISGEDSLHHHTCPAPDHDHGRCTCGAYEAMNAARQEEYKGAK
jgi:hypothetical protein